VLTVSFQTASNNNTAIAGISKVTETVHIIFYIYEYYVSTTHCSLLKLIVRSGLDVPTFVTTRQHPAAEGGTVGEKCPGIFA
jgi:hypothetical protein